MISSKEVPKQSWVDEWQRPPYDLTPEAVQWMRERPAEQKKIMVLFPPSCIVIAKRLLRVPAPNTVGIVTSYFEPTPAHPEGLITVRQSPEANLRACCDAEDLEVIGYWHGLDENAVERILKGDI